MKRNFIKIDEAKCNGCGNCVVACEEGALQIVEGKARVVNESFCDGLGACIGHCPTGALKIIQKDVAPFDEEAAKSHLAAQSKAQNSAGKNKFDVPCGCPGMASMDFRADERKLDSQSCSGVSSQLRQWPIQLHLVNPTAPYFQDSNLLIGATCTAFSFGNYHSRFIKNRSVVIACPKLDKTEGYVEKLAEIIRSNNILSITVVRMEVPCCKGLTVMTEEAIRLSGKKVPFLEEIISIKGDVL